jgi:hypothetical protein
MKRLDFIKTLGMIAGGGLIIPEAKSEKMQLPNYKSNADMNIGVERMRITSSGNIGLSNTSPSAKLIIN